MNVFSVIAKRGKRISVVGDYAQHSYAKRVARKAKRNRPGYVVRVVESRITTGFSEIIKG